MTSTTFLPLQVTLTNADNYTSGSSISLHWISTEPINYSTQWSPTLFLDILSSNNGIQSKKIQVWHHAPVATGESSFILPRISEHQQDVRVELWCSNINVPTTFLCGASPQFTLLPNTNKQLNKDIPKDNAAAKDDLPNAFLDPAPPLPPPSATGDSYSHLQVMAVPTTADVPPRKTKTPAACQENVPDPLCVPILPSFIGRPPPDPTMLPEPTSGPSNKESRDAGVEWIDGGTIAVIVIISMIIIALFSYWLVVRLHRKRRQQKAVGPYNGGSSGYDPGYRSMRLSSSSTPNSHSQSSYSLPMRENRIIPPWSLSYLGPPGNSGSNDEEPFGGGCAGEERDGQAPSPGPPFHISYPVQAEEPSFLEQCSEALELPYNHVHTTVTSTEGSSRPGLGSSVTSRLYNYTRTSATAAAGSSRPTSPCSVSSRYSAMSPGGAVAMQAANADTRSKSTAAQAPRARTLPQVDSISSPSAATTDFPHRRVPSPLPPRVAPRYGPMSTSPEPSSPSHHSTASTHSMRVSSPDDDGSPSPTPSPTHHQLYQSSFQVRPPEPLRPRRPNKNNKYINNNSNNSTGVYRLQNNDNYQIEVPMPAALTQTHLQAPIRSVMTISSEDGQVLSRKEVLIRMEVDHDLDHYHESRRYEQQRHHQRQQIPHTQPTHQGYSIHSQPRRGLMHQNDFCPSSDDVPPTPAIPEKYMYASSSRAPRPSSPSLSPPLASWSSMQRSAKPIGYDPEWASNEGSEGEEARYGGRSRRTDSARRAGGEMSRPQVQARGTNDAGVGYEQRPSNCGRVPLMAAQVQVVRSGRAYEERGGDASAWYI